MALKDQLKELRTVRGMTQEAVAEQLGVSSQTVSKWERGLLSPDISLLPRIAVLYRCSIDSLFQMNTVWGEEHRKEFQANILELCAQEDWEGAYRAWIREIEMNPDQYTNYLGVMKHVLRRKLFDHERIWKMLSLAEHAGKYCMDDDIRNDIYRVMVELCSHSEDPSVKERAKIYYNRIPKLRHSREIYAKFVMDGDEYRQQLKKNIIYMIDLTECSIRQLILSDMTPEEKLFYYRGAAALYETVLDDRYGGFYDVPLLCDYAEIASLLMQLGRAAEAGSYVDRIWSRLEKHMSRTEREDISAFLDAADAPGYASTEKLCVQVLNHMLSDVHLAVFGDDIHDMLQRYTRYFSLEQAFDS